MECECKDVSVWFCDETEANECELNGFPSRWSVWFSSYYVNELIEVHTSEKLTACDKYNDNYKFSILRWSYFGAKHETYADSLIPGLTRSQEGLRGGTSVGIYYKIIVLHTYMTESYACDLSYK